MLSSPGYPDPYSNKLRCVWRISTDPIRRIALGNAGDLFELEQGTTQDSCNHDWLAVYDGSSQKSRLIGRYCGNTMPTVRSSGRHLLVEFSTDWQQRRRGFQLHYITFFAGWHGTPCAGYTPTNCNNLLMQSKFEVLSCMSLYRSTRSKSCRYVIGDDHIMCGSGRHSFTNSMTYLSHTMVKYCIQISADELLMVITRSCS